MELRSPGDCAIGALLVMKYAPETRGLTLEQIEEKLAREAERPKRIAT